LSQAIGHKVSVSPALPDVSVSFNAQSHGGFAVMVYSAAGNEPTELYAGLQAIGFTSHGHCAQQGTVRESFGRHGSGLVGGGLARSGSDISLTHVGLCAASASRSYRSTLPPKARGVGRTSVISRARHVAISASTTAFLAVQEDPRGVLAGTSAARLLGWGLPTLQMEGSIG
jgi:hypothetical protein